MKNRKLTRKSKALPGVGCSELLGIWLAVSLIILSYFEFILHPPLYSFLRLWYLLSPLGYVCSLFLRDIIKPIGKHVDGNIAGEDQREYDNMIDCAGTHIPNTPRHRNSRRCGFLDLIRQFVVTHFNLNGHKCGMMPNM